jgi:hypothetical protein
MALAGSVQEETSPPFFLAFVIRHTGKDNSNQCMPRYQTMLPSMVTTAEDKFSI